MAKDMKKIVADARKRRQQPNFVSGDVASGTVKERPPQDELQPPEPPETPEQE